MKKTFLPLFLGAALALPQALLPGAAGAQEVTLQQCQDNVNPDKKLLSPKVAKACVVKLNANDAQLLNGMKEENPDEAAELVAYSNALVDLANLASKYSGADLGKALQRELDDDPCPICELRMGPQPEKSFDWISANTSGRLDIYKKSARTWSALGPQRTEALAAEPEHYNEGSWNRQTTTERYKRLSKWARAQTDRLVDMDKKAPGQLNMRELVSILWEDLGEPGDDGYKIKLNGLGAPKPAAPKGGTFLDKKGKEVAAAGKTAAGLKGLNASEQKDYLDTAFDKAKPGSGTPVVTGKPAKAFVPVPITPEQSALLSAKMGQVKDGKFTGYLADEMKGTRAGDELIAFFADKKYGEKGTNALNLKFEKGEGNLSNALGWWSGSDKTTRVNSNLVDTYNTNHQITPEQLLASEQHLKGVARYVAPNFVHETGHQRQDAWSSYNGLDYIKYRGGSTGAPYQMEMETESFSLQAAFSAEKAKKLGPAYLEQINPSHKDNAIRFMEDGVDKLRTDKHELYPTISSMEGSAAKELAGAKAAATYLRTLEGIKKNNPSGMTEEQKADLAKYRGMMDARFKWYTMVYQKSAADEKKLLEWRDSFSASDSLGTKAPPALKK